MRVNGYSWLVTTIGLLMFARPERIPAQVGGTNALQNPSINVPSEWLTKTERREFRQTPRYEETVAFCRRLAEASEWIEYRSFGKSGEGRELPLLIASKERAFTPQAARASQKLVVLAQSCIHPGEGWCLSRGSLTGSCPLWGLSSMSRLTGVCFAEHATLRVRLVSGRLTPSCLPDAWMSTGSGNRESKRLY